MSESEDLALIVEWMGVSQAFRDAKALRGTPEFDEDDYRAKKKAMGDLRTFWRQIADFAAAGGFNPPSDDTVITPDAISTGTGV